MTSSAASISAMLHCDDVLCNCYAYCVCVRVCKVCSTVCVLCVLQAVSMMSVCLSMCVCTWLHVCVYVNMCVFENVVWYHLYMMQCVDRLDQTHCLLLQPSLLHHHGPHPGQFVPAAGGADRCFFMNKADPVLQGWDATLCVDSLFGL